MLVTSIFSFSHNISTLSYWKIIFLATVNLSSVKCFQFGLVQNLPFGKGLKEQFYIVFLNISSLLEPMIEQERMNIPGA